MLSISSQALSSVLALLPHVIHAKYHAELFGYSRNIHVLPVVLGIDSSHLANVIGGVLIPAQTFGRL
jgi:hypothetical protein